MRRFVVYSLLCCLTPTLAWGREEVYSLDSCRVMAVAHNKQMAMTHETVKAARYARDAARAAYLPAVDFSGGYTYNQKKLSIFDSDQHLPIQKFNGTGYQFDLVTGHDGMPVKGPNGQYIPASVAYLPKDAMTYDIHNVFFGALTVTQPVYMGGKILAMNKLTGYAEEAARSLHDAGAEDVIYGVDAAYWQLVSLEAKQELARSYVALLDTLRGNVADMVAEGVATPSDMLTVEVKLNSAQVDLVKVDNGVKLCQMALAQLCGLPTDTPMRPSDTAMSTGRYAEVSDAVVPDMTEVWGRRSDLHALEMGVKMAHERSRVALSEMLPNVAIVGGYGFSNPNMYDGFKKEFNGAWAVGAVVKIPLIHWGGTYNKYRMAVTETNIMKLQLEDAREKVTLQVSQASQKAHEAATTLTMTRTNMAKADENLRQAQEAFKEGMFTPEKVMEAQTAWLKAASEQVDAAVDVNLCRVYLSKVLGTMNYQQYIYTSDK